VDHPSSGCVGGGLAVVDMACDEADLQRKSQLIQTKTAVLNDKERELRILEQRLAARERAISWQERQLDVQHNSKHVAAAPPPALESANKYYRNFEDSNGQQTKTYGGHLNAEQRQRSVEPRHHMLPPDAGVQVSSTRWPMEKLEEQFAKLTQTGTADAVPRQTGVNMREMYAQEPANVKPRPPPPPVMVLFHPADPRFNAAASHQNVLPRQYSTAAVRRRGRPKGSRNRLRMRLPSSSEAALAASRVPMYNQLMQNLYTHRHLLQRNPALAAAAKEAIHRGLLQANYRPPAPGHAGMMTAGGCQSMAQMFAGAQKMVPSEQVRRESGLGGRQPVLMSPQGTLQFSAAAATGAAAAITPTVQQLLASAACASAASILPPLSPVAAATEHDDVSARRDRIPHDQFQRGGNSANRDVEKNVVAYRVVDEGAVATGHSHNANAEQIVFVDSRFPAEMQRQHSSDQVPSHSSVSAHRDDCNHNAILVQSKGAEDSHILPKVTSFDAGNNWNSGQLGPPDETVQPDGPASDHKSTARCRNIDDGDDDDDDNRLVVVIEGD